MTSESDIWSPVLPCHHVLVSVFWDLGTERPDLAALTGEVPADFAKVPALPAAPH